MPIGKRKVMLKPIPIRDDVERKALNIKCGEKSILSLYVRRSSNILILDET